MPPRHSRNRQGHRVCLRKRRRPSDRRSEGLSGLRGKKECSWVIINKRTEFFPYPETPFQLAND